MTIRQWTLSSINQLVKQFEQGALPKEEWTHHAHLVVCSYYLYHFGYQEATLRIKLGIIRFNDAIGTENTIDGGYHETLTLFWIWAVNAYITDQTATLEELVNGLLNSPYSKKYLPFFFFAEDHLFSHKARARWVDPNLHPLKASLIESAFIDSIWYGDDLV